MHVEVLHKKLTNIGAERSSRKKPLLLMCPLGSCSVGMACVHQDKHMDFAELVTMFMLVAVSLQTPPSFNRVSDMT